MARASIAVGLIAALGALVLVGVTAVGLLRPPLVPAGGTPASQATAAPAGTPLLSTAGPASSDAAPTTGPDGSTSGDEVSVSQASTTDVAPAALAGKPWTAIAPAGTVLTGLIGNPARMRLPEAHKVLGTVGSVVVSAQVAGDGTTSTVSFSSLESGTDVFKPVTVAGQLFIGAAAGNTVYATGLDVVRGRTFLTLSRRR